AAAGGLAGAAAVFYFLARVLVPGQTIMDPAEYTMPGTIGRLTRPIRAGGIGEIVYKKGGSRRSDGARSLSGEAIERDAEVVIVRYENGLAYVELLDRYLAEEGSSRPALPTPAVDGRADAGHTPASSATGTAER